MLFAQEGLEERRALVAHALRLLRGCEHLVDAREQRGPISHGIQRPHFDEALQRPLVHDPLVDTHAEVIEVLIWFPAALRGDCFRGSRAHVLYRGEAKVDRALFDGKIGFAFVHVRGRHGHFQAAALAHRLDDLVGVAKFSAQDRRHVLGGVVRFEIGGLVGNGAVAGCVGLIEPVARKGFEVVEDLLRQFLRQTFVYRALHEPLTVLLQFVGDLLAHGVAELIRLGQRVAGHRLRHGHHVFLINHDAVGALEHCRHQGMPRRRLLAPVPPRDVLRDVCHGAGTVQRHQGHNVLDAVRL